MISREKVFFPFFEIITCVFILKQLFPSGSVIIGEYSPRLRLGEYSPIITKSVGPDDISPKLLKLAGKAIVPALVNLYNYSIEKRIVFSLWKTARLTPLFKKDDETDCRNYRPVSLLSVPSKILEAEIKDRVVQHAFVHNQLTLSAPIVPNGTYRFYSV